MTPRPTQLPRLKTGVYGLVGRRISYSQSPLIFRRVFDALDWPAVYGVFDLHPAQLPRFVAAAADAGITGFNVTQPYKVRIMRYLDRIDPDADAIGAVNTVVRRGRSWVGHNTDVDGIHEALSRYRDDLRKTSAIIIGAGGAARAAAYALANRLAMSEVTFAVRSLPKGRAVVRELSRRCRTDCRWSVRSLTRSVLNERLTDTSLLVNATPVGGAGLDHRSPVPQGVRIPRSAVVFDLIYSPRKTRLLADAASAGCRKLVGGWPMLVAQADASLFLWTGTRFPPGVKAQLLAMEIAQ